MNQNPEKENQQWDIHTLQIFNKKTEKANQIKENPERQNRESKKREIETNVQKGREATLSDCD